MPRDPTVVAETAEPRVEAGGTIQLRARADGLQNDSVRWSMPFSAKGSVTPTGLYTAPFLLRSDSIVQAVTATSIASPSLKLEVPVTIVRGRGPAVRDRMVPLALDNEWVYIRVGESYTPEHELLGYRELPLFDVDGLSLGTKSWYVVFEGYDTVLYAPTPAGEIVALYTSTPAPRGIYAYFLASTPVVGATMHDPSIAGRPLEEWTWTSQGDFTIGVTNYAGAWHARRAGPVATERMKIYAPGTGLIWYRSPGPGAIGLDTFQLLRAVLK